MHTIVCSVLAATLATGVGGAAGAHTQAEDAATARLLTAGELRPAAAADPWMAGPIRDGLPRATVACVPRRTLRISGGEARHRSFAREFGEAQQIVLEMPSARKARALMKEMVASALRCPDTDLPPGEGGSASVKDFGPLDVTGAARVVRVRSGSPEFDGQATVLVGVGRRGTLVTILAMREPPGRRTVAKFETTTVRSTEKLG